MLKNHLSIIILLVCFGNLYSQVDSAKYKKVEENIRRGFDLLYLDLDSAFIYANSSLQYAIENNDAELQVKACRVVAMVYYSLTKYDSAFHFLDQAERLYTPEMDSSLIMSIIANKANIYSETQQIEKALLMYEEVKEYYEQNNQTINIGKVTATIANLMLLSDKPEEAMIHYNEALAYFKKVDFKVGIAIAYQNKGLIFSVFKDYDSAMYYTFKAVEIYKKGENYNLLYSCYGNLADYYEYLGKIDSAIYYINITLKGFEDGGALRDLSVTYMHKAKLSYETGNINEALEYTLKAKKIAFENSFPDVLIESYEFAYKLYKEQGQVTLALTNLEYYKVLKDSLHKQELLSHEDELIAEYSIDKREKEIELLKTKDTLKAALIRKQQNAMIAIGLLAAIIALISISILRRLRIKRTANEILVDKNEEINAQNEEIRAQSEEIIKQNDRLIEHKEEITDSINYARFIQQSIFTAQVNESIEHFRYNKPKDIVSGDFFWYEQTDNYNYFAVADCTGHGVPGAFMSLLGFTFLNQAFKKQPEPAVDQMLEYLRVNIKKALNHSANIENTKDGMDIALIRVHKTSLELDFAGAYRPIWIFDDNGFTEIKGDKQPIGYFPKEKEYTLKTHQIKGDAKVYLFTDGLVDQVSDDETQKLKVKGFLELIDQIKDKPMAAQQETIDEFYQSFVGRANQIDDILVVGISLKRA